MMPHPLDTLAARLEALCGHAPAAARPSLYYLARELAAARVALRRACEALGTRDTRGAALAHAEALGAVDAAAVAFLMLADVDDGRAL